MFFSAVTFLCLLGLAASADPLSSETCVVPEGQQWLVTGLENQLGSSVRSLSSPDPSTLIALNMAGDQSCVTHQLLQQIKNTSAQEMTSGKVALYILALQSSCENPANVATPEKMINLVHVLEEKTKEEIESYNKKKTPKTTFYQLSLDTLALCVEESQVAELAVDILAKAAGTDAFQLGGHFSVDTAAVASLALACEYDRLFPTQQSRLTGDIQHALSILTDKILQEQEKSGIIGNIYSTGLAIQALSVTSEFYLPKAWDCTKTLTKVLQEAYLGAFNTPGAISQILPSLVGKTYLDVKNLPCSSALIKVNYTIVNDLVGKHFKYSTIVEVPKCSVLLAVLEEAQRTHPSHFSFKTEKTSWGALVISINDIEGNNNEKTYWQFLSGGKPIDQGVGSYKPSDNEQIMAIFSKY